METGTSAARSAPRVGESDMMVEGGSPSPGAKTRRPLPACAGRGEDAFMLATEPPRPDSRAGRGEKLGASRAREELPSSTVFTSPREAGRGRRPEGPTGEGLPPSTTMSLSRRPDQRPATITPACPYVGGYTTRTVRTAAGTATPPTRVIAPLWGSRRKTFTVALVLLAATRYLPVASMEKSQG
jgi:hypothetical protein